MSVDEADAGLSVTSVKRTWGTGIFSRSTASPCSMVFWDVAGAAAAEQQGDRGKEQDRFMIHEGGNSKIRSRSRRSRRATPRAACGRCSNPGAARNANRTNTPRRVVGRSPGIRKADALTPATQTSRRRQRGSTLQITPDAPGGQATRGRAAIEVGPARGKACATCDICIDRDGRRAIMWPFRSTDGRGRWDRRIRAGQGRHLGRSP